MLPVIEFRRSKPYENGLLNLLKRQPLAQLEKNVFLECFEKLKAEKDTLNKILKSITEILKVDWLIFKTGPRIQRLQKRSVPYCE